MLHKQVTLTCSNQRRCILVGSFFAVVDYDVVSSCLDTPEAALSTTKHPPGQG